MPYSTIADLPEEQTDQYSPHQKHAFLKAFNSALERYGDEGRRSPRRTPPRSRRPGTSPTRARGAASS